MGTYSHKAFACPFYKSDRRKGDVFVISCEGCLVRLPGRRAFNEFTTRHCCDGDGWTMCTVARALQRYYDGK